MSHERTVMCGCKYSDAVDVYKKKLIITSHGVVCTFQRKTFISWSLQFIRKGLGFSRSLFLSHIAVLKISSKANDLCKWISYFTYLIGNTLANFEHHLSMTSSVSPSPHAFTHTYYTHPPPFALS